MPGKTLFSRNGSVNALGADPSTAIFSFSKRAFSATRRLSSPARPRRLTLTDFVVPRTPRGVRDGHLKKLIIKEDVVAKFNKTAWAQKIEKRKIRASLNDFDRFKLMKLKKKVTLGFLRIHEFPVTASLKAYCG
ncbi:MAG: ribosomal protein L14-domain-containing protein, partial [Olpidium bornovanus]